MNYYQLFVLQILSLFHTKGLKGINKICAGKNNKKIVKYNIISVIIHKKYYFT